MSWFRRASEVVGEGAGTRASDRRGGSRLDKVFPVWLEGEHGCGMGIARNISEGGMFVETATPHPIGSQVQVAFPSESGDMIAVAEVRYVCHLVGRRAGQDVHASVHGMGVRFLYFEARGEAVRALH
jgi:hypothetical protein